MKKQPIKINKKNTKIFLNKIVKKLDIFFIKSNIFYEKYQVEESVLVISQAKIYDRRRFIKQIGYLEQNEFSEIKKLLKNIYF